jgi:hypothetical protein
VLFFNNETIIAGRSRSTEATVGSRVTVSDLVRLFDHSILNSTVVVKPFCAKPDPLLDSIYYELCKDENIKPEYLWKDVDPELVSNIPAVPINSHPDTPGLPDRVDWLSPFWDTCLQIISESAQQTFLRANTDRIKLATSGKARKDSCKSYHEQTIFYVPGPDTSKAPIRSAINSLLGTEVAGPLGTTPAQRAKCTVS